MAKSTSDGRIQAQPGLALKALRADRGWTLSDVSAKTGLPVSSLSKMENGKIALTFDKLVRLSKALDVDIARLFGSPTSDVARPGGAMRRSITRAGEGRAIETARGNYLYLAGELLNKTIVPILGEVFAKDISTYGEMLKHHGEEFVYVIEGTLELHTEMYTPARLEVGDSVYFDSGMRHAYIAVGDAPCRILSICATPEAEIIDTLESASTVEQDVDPNRLPNVRRAKTLA